MPFAPYLTAFRHLLLATSALLLLGLSAPKVAYAEDDPASSEDESAKTSATPDGTDEATEPGYDALSAQAAEAYRAGDFPSASALFRRAYALKPVANLLYNIGRAEEKAGNFEAAVEYYEKFATQAGVNIKSREEALARMRVLREVIELNARPEAEDTREEMASAPIEVATPQPAPTQPAPIAPPAPRIERDYSAAWITLSVAAAAYITSGAFAWQARQAHIDFDSATSRQELREAADWGQTSSIIADSALGVGAILTALGVYFIISPTERPVDEARSVRVTPQLGPGEVGLDWAIRF